MIDIITDVLEFKSKSGNSSLCKPACVSMTFILWWDDAFNLIISIISLFIQIPLLISLIIRLHQNGDDENVYKTYKACAITAFLFAILTSIGGIIESIFDAYSYDIFEWPWMIGLELQSNAPVGVALSTYMFLLFRLYYTFNDTLYQTKKYIFYCHGLNLILLLIVIAIFIILPQPGLEISIIWIVLLSIGYAQLLFSFNYNLFLLALSQRKTIINEQQLIHNNKELTDKQMRLLSTIRKHTILGCIMMICNVLYVGSMLLLYQYVYSDRLDTFTAWKICMAMYLVLWSIFANGAPISIYLGFTVNVNTYICICGPCDRKCDTFCLRMAQKSLNQQNTYISINK